MTATPAIDEIAAPDSSKTHGVVDVLIAQPAATVLEIPLEQLLDNPYNPRTSIGDVSGMAQSMRQVGIIEPLVVVTADAFNAAQGEGEPTVVSRDDLELYVVVAGHRRKAAAADAELVTARCEINNRLVGDVGRAAMLIENMQREGLSPLDEAEGMQQLRVMKWTQQRIADEIGVSQSYVSKRLSLQSLPHGIKSRIGTDPAAGGVTIEQAEQIARLDEHTRGVIARDLADIKHFHAHTVPTVIRDVTEAHERDKQRAAALKRLRAAKIPVLNAEGDAIDTDHLSYSSDDGPCPLRWLAPFDQRDAWMLEHVTEPCHAAVITSRPVAYNTTDPAENWITYICTDPASHKPADTTDPDGEDEAATSESDEDAARRAAEEQHRAQVAEINDRRRTFLRAQLDMDPGEAAVEHVTRGACLDAIIGDFYEGRHVGAAAALIEYDQPAYLEPIISTLTDPAERGITDDVWRLTYAARLAADDDAVRAVIGRDADHLHSNDANSLAYARFHLAYLTSIGYELDDLEQQITAEPRFTLRDAIEGSDLDDGLAEPDEDNDPRNANDESEDA